MIITRKKTASRLIQGPTGKLEVVVEEAHGMERGSIAVVCHPHPLYGGTMNNKVVTTLGKTFQHLGLGVVRFNFRGIGQSEGVFGNAEGEIDDLLAVLGWLAQVHPQKTIWLAGFSFGAYVAARVAVSMPVQQLVTVAPPVEHFPMHELPPILCPWVLVQGEKDEVVPPQAVIAWAEARDPKPQIVSLPEADHFFHGQLGELRTSLEAVLTKC